MREWEEEERERDPNGVGEEGVVIRWSGRERENSQRGIQIGVRVVVVWWEESEGWGVLGGVDGKDWKNDGLKRAVL